MLTRLKDYILFQEISHKSHNKWNINVTVFSNYTKLRYQPEVDDVVLSAPGQVRVQDHVAVSSKQLVLIALLNHLQLVRVPSPLHTVDLLRQLTE